jgi:hypothetical protein
MWVDVLVVLAGEVDPIAEIRVTKFLVADLSLKHDLVISCVIYDAEELEKRSDSFLRNVRQEAVAV